MLNFEVGKTYRKTTAVQQRTWKCVAIEGDVAVLCDPTNPICLQAVDYHRTDYWQEYTEPKIHTAQIALFKSAHGQRWYDSENPWLGGQWTRITDWINVASKEKTI